MIWYKNSIKKEGGKVEVIGYFTSPFDMPENIIEVKIKHKNKSRKIFVANPALGRTEDPLPEDVYAKYHSKISKIEEMVKKQTIEQLFF